MVTLKLMTLSGKFDLQSIQQVESRDVLAIVQAHAESGGYTNVKCVQDVDSNRYTARTPGGRSGRNIAYVDFPDYL